jgi:hypothetical protein
LDHTTKTATPPAVTAADAITDTAANATAGAAASAGVI